MSPITIHGAGYSGCLLLAALKKRWPDLHIQICEKAERLGSSQTWSFHHSEVPTPAWKWLAPLISHIWDGYTVRFPHFHRDFNSFVYSIRSEDLYRKLFDQYSESFLLGYCPEEVGPNDFVTTGRPTEKDTQNYSYCNFVGLDVRIKGFVRVRNPLLYDVRINQEEGLRYFSLLPWSESEILIKNHFYSRTPEINLEKSRKDILNYLDSRGWEVMEIYRTEVGSLPLDIHRELHLTHPMALGSAAGLIHPLTGSSTPFLLRQIQAILNCAQPDPVLFQKALRFENRFLEGQLSYLRFLNRMMFLTDPEKRYLLLERLFRGPEESLRRFYSGTINNWDKTKLAWGSFPAPLFRTLTQRDLPPA